MLPLHHPNVKTRRRRRERKQKTKAASCWLGPQNRTGVTELKERYAATAPPQREDSPKKKRKEAKDKSSKLLAGATESNWGHLNKSEVCCHYTTPT
jgi:hypothetical protein